MTGYTRNDGPNNIADGNIVQASDIDGEYDAIEAAFNNSTGHDHSGTAAEGAPIEVVGPAQDLVVTAAKVEPKTDNTLDLGSSSKEFKDLYLDGTANIDSLVADTADINAGTIDGTTIGGGTAAAGTFTTATATTGNITNVNATTVDTTNVEVTNLKAKDGTSAGSIADSTGVVTLASSVLTTTDINGGTIDGATIATSDITVGSGKTLDVSAGTLTLANDQISGDKINGGTIGSVTITSLTATSADINGGTIDGVTIGGASAGAGTFTTLQANTSLNVDGTVTADGLTVSGSGTAQITSTNFTTLELIRSGSAGQISSLIMKDGGSAQNRISSSGGALEFEYGASNLNALKIDNNGDISFYEDTGTTPKLFWDASAEALGLGTSSIISGVRFQARADTDKNFIVFSNAAGTSLGSTNDIGSSNLLRLAGAPLIFTGSGGSGAEHMRIDSSGNLLVGTTVAPAVGVTGMGYGRFPANPSDTSLVLSFNGTGGNFEIVFVNNNGLVGSVTTSGSATSYNTSSDYRLKENVVDITNAIDRVKALKPSRFNFIADPDTTVDGFIAHEAQEIVPEAVTGEKDEVEAIGNITDAEGVVVQEGVIEPSELPEGQAWTKTGDRPVMQGIDQAKLVPLLTGALKEAIARIETLEAEVAALKGA